MTDITLITLDSLTKKFADARTDLSAAVSTLESQIEALKRAALPQIKRAVARAAEHQNNLGQAIDSARHLFDKPRTVVMHGIKIGLRKGAGGIDWEDDDKVVALIEKHFSKAQADLLVKTTKKPIAKALQDLDVAELKKLGCTVESTGDEVVIHPTDTAVDKLVNALLKDALDESAQEAA